MIAGKSLVRQIEDLPTDAGDKPLQSVVIADCGVLGEGEDVKKESKVDGDVWEDWPEDQEGLDEGDLMAYVKIADALKELGSR